MSFPPSTAPAEARTYLKRWCTAAKRSRIPAFANLVRRIEKHFDAIIAAVPTRAVQFSAGGHPEARQSLRWMSAFPPHLAGTDVQVPPAPSGGVVAGRCRCPRAAVCRRTEPNALRVRRFNS